MAAHEKRLDRAARHGREMLRGVGAEIRTARLDRDLSQRAAAAAMGTSRGTWYRIERGLATGVRLEDLARAAAIVGLDLSLRTYPGGKPLRDRPQTGLLERLRLQLARGVGWRTEVPMPTVGDQRAWDAMITIGPIRIGVEAETRARDAQALERRIALKQRDSGVDHVILLLADTRHDRSFVAAAGRGLTDAYPVPGAVALARLAEGVDPGGSAIIFL